MWPRPMLDQYTVDCNTWHTEVYDVHCPDPDCPGNDEAWEEKFESYMGGLTAEGDCECPHCGKTAVIL